MKKVIFIIGGIIILVVVIVGVIAVSQYVQEQHQEQQREWEQEYKQQFKTIEGIAQYIEGKTWVYAEPIKRSSDFCKWFKFKFSNGKVTLWTAYPSDGRWGEPDVFDYTIEKTRYTDTGEYYIRVVFSCGYKFVPEKSIFYGRFDSEGDYVRSCDKNYDEIDENYDPWEELDR